MSIWAEETSAEVARWRWYDELVKRFLQSSSGSSPLNPGREMNTPEQLVARLTHANFADVSIQSETKDFAYTTAEEWWPIARIFLYHSRDDEVVPFAHLALYAAKLPQATIRQFDEGGHQIGNDLADVAEDITRAETSPEG